MSKPMEQWAYMIHEIPLDYPAEMEAGVEELNRLAGDSWEAISMTPIEAKVGARIVGNIGLVFLKRRVS